MDPRLPFLTDTVLVPTLVTLDPKYPAVDDAARQPMPEARAELAAGPRRLDNHRRHERPAPA